MNKKTYEALKDLVKQLEDIGLAKLNTLGEGNISTLITMLKGWIDEVAKEYKEEKKYKCPNCETERVNEFPISDETGERYCPDCNTTLGEDEGLEIK